MITDTININGVPVHLIDTAGIREPQNAIEKEGISLVWESLANADVVIVMLDISKPLTDEDKIIIDKNTSGNIIVAINKIDLPRKWEENIIKELFSQETKILKISANSFSLSMDKSKLPLLAAIVKSVENLFKKGVCTAVIARSMPDFGLSMELAR